MIHTNRNEKRRFVKFLIVFFILFCFLVPILSIFFGDYGVYEENESYNQQALPRAHSITKDNYEPILSEEKYGLGNITVNNITMDAGFQEGISYVGGYSSEINKLLDDLTGGGGEEPGLNMSSRGITFINTTRVAIVDNLNENITDNNIITVILNETISVQYNISKTYPLTNMEGFLIYHPRLDPCIALDLYVQENGSSVIKRIDDGNFSIYSDINFLRFNYNDTFGGVETNNFSMYIIWEYNITITKATWKITQYPETGSELHLLHKEQTIHPKFNYVFNLDAKRLNYSLDPLVDTPVGAEDVNFNLNVNLPDKDLLNKTKLLINSQSETITNFLNPDNSMHTGDNFKGNNSEFSLDFNCNFTIKFELAVDKNWAIDRLVSGRNTRERIYIPTISEGPSYIYLKYAAIFENTISIDQVRSNTSLFDRILLYYDANVTVYEAPTPYSLIFTDNSTKKKGLEIILPYMIKGETSPFIIKYVATRSLHIKITDNIDMPLVNFKVEIYFYGIIYGTYMSIDRTQPIAPTITNDNGEVLIKNVPNGNYTLIVYQNDIAILETSVSAYVEINYITTEIPHFPLSVIIFALISGVIAIIGFILYKKNKR